MVDRRQPWTRRIAAAAVVLVVLLAHGGIADRFAERMTALETEAPMPPRMAVVYVREMEIGVPQPAVPQRPAFAPRSKKKRIASSAKPAASAPQALPSTDTSADTPSATPPPQELASSAASPPPAAPSSASPSPPAVAASAASSPWPGSTRLSYVLTGNYRGEIAGNAQVEWIRVGTRYQVHLDVTVGLPFAPLLSRHISSEGVLTPDGLVPERYDEESQVAFQGRRRATIRFADDAIVLSNGRRHERWPGVQDAASQFVQLTYGFTLHPQRLARGTVIDVPLALPRSVSHWVYDVLDQETLYTPFGAVDAVHLAPRRIAQPGGELTAEMWFAPSLAYLPVRIRIRQDEQTFIDLMIRRKPQLAAP